MEKGKVANLGATEAQLKAVGVKEAGFLLKHPEDANESKLGNKMNKEYTVIKPEVLAYDPNIKGVTLDEKQANYKPPVWQGNGFEFISRDDCKYCHGRGYERWLFGRIKHLNGSIEESFEERQCRCIKVKVIRTVDLPATHGLATSSYKGMVSHQCLCGKVFNGKDSFRKHMNFHTEPEPYAHPGTK